MSSHELSASMQVSGGFAEFTVSTANPIYRQELVAIGFQRTGDDSFARHLSVSSDIEYIFENFSRHVEEILLQHAGTRPVRWEEASREFLKRVEGTEVRWWLAGSAALAVRGIDVAPRDLDFAVSDAHVVGRLLEDLLVEPVTNMKHWVAEWFGRAFHGALIEWVSDVHPDAADQGLEQGPAAANRLDTIRWAGHTVRVTPLDLQLAVAERRSQQELAEKIRGLLGH